MSISEELKMKGYQGKLLEIDLGKKKIKNTKLKEELAKKFIGGTGLAAKLLYESMTEDLDPLRPENPLAFINGPFAGTPVPSAGRYSICAKSPLTNIWGESNSGGFFGVSLKMAGYDGVIITGRSDEPSYLSIKEDGVDIEDASDLWGKGFYETRDTLREKVESKRARIAGIGQAGESMVKYASVMNDHGRAAGRTGMGAVMGSKNLKAIVVEGSKSTKIADPEELRKLVKSVNKIPITSVASLSTLEMYKEFGSMGYLDIGMYLADTPAKLYEKSVFPTDEIDGVALREKYYVESTSCYGCPIACGRSTEYNKRGVEKVDGPEYETTVSLGPLCMNFDMDSIVYANHLCNDYGLDTISAGVSIAFAMKLYEEGKIGRKDADVNIEWGNADAIITLLEKIAKREGIGDKLAEGVRKMSEEFGVPRDQSPHVKGMEIPMHDPRAFTGMALSYATSPRGACHLKGDYYLIGMGRSIPDAGISSMDRFESSKEKGAMAARWQNLRELYDSLPLCKFSPIDSPTSLAKILNAVTGWETDAKNLMKIGERIFNLKRIINHKLGIGRGDDELPEIVTEALSEGCSAGKGPNMKTLLSGHYEERGWDPETGKPTEERLDELGLSEEGKDIY